MNLAYYILTENNLLKEITKWYILQYIHFPDVFLDKICDDRNIDKVKELLKNGHITIDLLNNFVADVFSQYYYGLPDINGLPNVQIAKLNYFIEYILLYKSCPQLLTYILDKYPYEQQIIINSEIFKSREIMVNGHLEEFNPTLIHLQNNKFNYETVCKILNISSKIKTDVVSGICTRDSVNNDEIMENYRLKYLNHTLQDDLTNSKIMHEIGPNSENMKDNNFIDFNSCNIIKNTNKDLRYSISNFYDFVKNMKPPTQDCPTYDYVN